MATLGGKRLNEKCLPGTPAYKISDERFELGLEVIALIEKFETSTGAYIKSLTTISNIEKGAGGLDPDKEVRTIDIQITI
jgi:hypothetical protein